jgi:hypothetical protein
MMHYPHNHNGISIDMVKYPVPPVEQTTNAIAQIRAGRSGHRMLAQKRKSCVKSQKVAVCDFATKSINTVDPNFEQIGARCRTEIKLSHFLPDIRP